MERDYRSSTGQQYPADPQAPAGVQFQQSSRPWMTSSDAAACATGSTLGTALGVVSGAALGAAAMYLLDPDKGYDRRHHLAEAAEDALETTTDTWGVLGKGATRAGSSLGDRFSEAASSLSASMPSRRQMNRSGRRFLKNVRRGTSSAASSVGDTADSWLDSARSYLPNRPQLARPTDVSATTAGLSGMAALAIGVGAMWLFDPRQGRGRRAWLGQKANRFLNETGRFMRATGRHLANKSKGYYYETASAAQQAAQSVSSYAGGSQQSSGDVSSAHNTLPRSGGEVSYRVESTSTGASCPPGTLSTGGATGAGI